jgi:RNA recognition motif-containing protein
MPVVDTTKLHNLKVGNLTFDTTQRELQEIFEKYGEVADVYIPLDGRTRR